MPKEDLIDLLLHLSKEQMNPTVRTDTTAIVDILLSVPETVTATDTVTVTSQAHPVKWGAAGDPTNAKWSFFTWG